MQDAETKIRAVISELLERRGAGNVEMRLESGLSDDLGLDSLELAELSATLEDELGSDPYSAEVPPRTLADLVDFYHN